MHQQKAVIISCAVTGAIHTPSMSPHLPVTPEQIAESSIAAARAGAAIIHLHARDPLTGKPDQRPEAFTPFLDRIKRECDAVVNLTTGGSPYMTVQERIRPATELRPEVASMNMGSMGFGLFPMLERFKEFKHDWERPYLEGSKDLVFRNTYGDIETSLRELSASGTRFEFECYDTSHLYNLAYFIDRGLIKPPFFVQTVFGILGGIGAHPDDVMHMKRTADRLFGDDYRWSVLGAGRNPTEVRPNRYQDSLYHDLMTPEETLAIREEVRRFAEEHVAPVSHRIGHTEEAVENFPRELFNRMAQAGLFRIPFAADVGGRGLKYPATATAVMIEELAYHSNSVAAVVDVHCILAGNALKNASASIKERYLKPLLSGEKIGSFATTEPEASTDLSVKAMCTVAERQTDGGYVVSGRKRFITNSPVADFVVLLCVDDGRMTELVIDLHAPGVRVGTPDKKMGNHGQLTADICFDKVRVPEHNVVGQPGQGLKIALQTLTYGRIGIAASGVGMAQALFDHSAERLKTRRAFGKSIAHFQHWQFKMAERATEIENARNLYFKAALRMDAGQAFPEPEAAMAKWYGTNLAGEFARDAVQIFGGYGFMRELGANGSHFRVEEIYRDSKIAEIYEGTNEIQKLVIARGIFGKDITG